MQQPDSEAGLEKWLDDTADRRQHQPSAAVVRNLCAGSVRTTVA
jgi:hypothetical protein